MRLKSFKTGEPQQISNISNGKPVLLGPRDLHTYPLGEANERFPKMVVSCYQQPSVSLAKRF